MSFIPQRDWLTEVSKGRIPNHERVLIRGININVGTSFETVWPEGGNKIFQSAAAIQTLSSDNANDTILGTGARIIRVKGLLADYSEAEEDVEMDGLTEVSTVNSYLRINQILIKAGEVGSLGFNNGTIYIGTGVVTSGKPAVVNNLISPARSISESGFFTVPLGKRLLSYSRTYAVDTGKSCVIAITLIEQGTKYSNLTIPIVQSVTDIPDDAPTEVKEKIDIIWSSISTSGGGTEADVSIRAVNVLYTPST